MNLQVIATLLAALSFIATGLGLSWKFVSAFGQLQSRDAELKNELVRLEVTASTLSTALTVLPSLVQRMGAVEDATKRNTSDIKGLVEKVAHVRGRYDSHHDLDES
jgi:hypothetical protein